MKCMLALAAVAATAAAAAPTFISNIDPRRDVNGALMDAHDGSTIQFESGGDYYWHAMGYGQCIENGKHADGHCGQLSNNTVGVWSSPTLASGSWTQRSSFTPSDSGWPTCLYYRAHAAMRRDSNGTATYVLYLNGQGGQGTACDACPDGSSGKCIFAGVSASPSGPFEYRGVVPLRYTTLGGVGDFDVFVDVDAPGTALPKPAYAIYKRSGAAPGASAHRMTLQRLDDSYLGVVPGPTGAGEGGAAAGGGSAGIIGSPFVEAPALFTRRGVYYALFGKCCAFCAQGSGIGVYTAPAALGPWTARGQIGCTGGDAPVDWQHGCGCGLVPSPALMNGTTCPKQTAHALTHAQQNSVIRVRGTAGDGGNDDVFMWTGDRWQSACRSTCEAQGVPPGPVDLGCVKAWDFQYWSPLAWDDEAVPPVPRQLHWQDNFTFTV